MAVGESNVPILMVDRKLTVDVEHKFLFFILFHNAKLLFRLLVGHVTSANSNIACSYFFSRAQALDR